MENQFLKADCGIAKKILKLKKEKNAAVLAHFYQSMEIQEIADLVGDSHELARKASSIDCDILIVCGVTFMAESAKILNPSKKVLHPEPGAGCPMADMLSPDDILKLKEKYPEAAVVCYVNSTAKTKAVSDICCTSSNAVKVVSSLPNKQIIFVPDKNLGNFVAKQIPEKEFIFFDGGCPIHKELTVSIVNEAKKNHPDALFAVHPECSADVIALADFAGSTSQIISYVQESDAKEFLIGTEIGVVERLKKLCPEKNIILISEALVCPDMKKITLDSVLNVLENESNEVIMSDEEINKAAYSSLYRMVQV